MITALVIVACLLAQMLVFAHFGRYWLKTKILPRLAREGFCPTCMGRSLRGENDLERPMTLRAEAGYGMVYVLFTLCGPATAFESILGLFLEQVRYHPDLESFRAMQHPDCHRGRCACGTPRCDGHTT